MVEIIVSKDRCPLAAIAEMGQFIQNAWIFLNSDVVKRLKETATTIIEMDGYLFNIGGRIVQTTHFEGGWEVIKKVIVGDGIQEFKEVPEYPQYTVLVKMAK